MSVLLPGSPGPLGSPETQRTLAGSAPVFWEKALWCCSPWSCAPRVTARAGWTGRRSGAHERVRVQEDAVRWSCPGQSGVVPGWEAQKTCLIGPGGRLYHIRELGPGRAGTSLSLVSPSQVAMLHGVSTGDRKHSPFGALRAQRAFAASGVTRGIALCPSDTLNQPCACLPDCCG